MPKKKIFLIFFIIALFYLGENYFLPKKIAEFDAIEKNISELKNNDLITKENNLKEAYGYDDYLEYNIEYSKILFRDIYNFNNEITIYKGKNNNIKKNNLVINKNGLVGVVKKVDDYFSIVELLYNNNINLSVKINNSYGILKCKNKKLVVEGINNKSEIKKDDIVTTSDISIYPENIKIGKVIDVTFDKYEIEQIITIEPFVNFENINYIGIITDLRGEV